jgi:carbon-monoxide dehydrogenase medium subunit
VAGSRSAGAGADERAPLIADISEDPTVYPAEFEYFSPATVEEALELLTRCGEDARILAGGQSLIPMMKLRIASPRCLIDVNRIEALAGLARQGDRLVFGALCRHADIGASLLVKDHLPLMHDAAWLTADVQVRNRGTIGGSLAHADPAGDWPAALLALDTEVTIAGPGGTRTVALAEFLVGPFATRLASNEMVTRVSVGSPSGRSGGAYVKFERRAGDFAVASVGVQIDLSGERLRSVAISLGAVGPVPTRAHAAEARLAGRDPDPAILDDAARLVRAAAEPFDDTRGSADYKRHLTGVMFRRAFDVALRRAHGASLPTLAP